MAVCCRGKGILVLLFEVERRKINVFMFLARYGCEIDEDIFNLFSIWMLDPLALVTISESIVNPAFTLPIVTGQFLGLVVNGLG